MNPDIEPRAPYVTTDYCSQQSLQYSLVVGLLQLLSFVYGKYVE